jgi:uncharacterized CHY-type Zn-finger protein
VALDAALCGRFAACTACGQALDAHAWFDIWTRSDGQLSVPVAICSPCKRTDPQKVLRVMDGRYGP